MLPFPVGANRSGWLPDLYNRPVNSMSKSEQEEPAGFPMSEAVSNPSSDGRVWRVFTVAPRTEKRVEERIRMSGIEVFLPVILVERQWSDRKRTIPEPLFRGYIFARVNERERIDTLALAGVSRSVSFGGKTAEVSDEEIARIRILAESGGRIFEADIHLPPGTPVVVSEGPFRGLNGELVEYRGRRRVLVRLEAVRQAVAVVVPQEFLKAVEE
jgi:transcription antitermination factor NusG